MATPTITHTVVTGAAANADVLVDGPAWDAAHTVTGLENVPNVDTTNASNLTSGTVSADRLPNPTSSTLGGVRSIAAATHNWITSISTSGVPAQSQPAFSDISGSVAASQMPALTGDVTTVAGAVSTTLATVNSNVGTFGSVSTSPVFTVNGKGLVTAASAVSIRERLLVNTDYFVRTDGSDSNTGLSNTAGGAFLTIGGALNNIAFQKDLNGKLVQIRVQGGTYTGNVFVPQWVGFDAVNGFSQLKVIGENGTVTMTSASASPCIFSTKAGPPVTFENITFTNPAVSGILVYMDDYGFVSLKSCTFGATGAGGIKLASALFSNILLQASTFENVGNSGILIHAVTKSAITCQPGCVFHSGAATTFATSVVNVDATSSFVNLGTSFTGTVPTAPPYTLIVPGSISDVSLVAGSGSPVLTTLPVGSGGTGQIGFTSGGIPYANSSNTLASSAALSANALLLGGGAGGAPTNVGSLGTTTTLLHGNAAGAPTFGAVSLTADVSGTLPAANGGTNYTGGAWSAFTPTITAGSGTFTSVSGSGRQLTIGKLVHFQISFTITTNGTAAAFISATLPGNAVGTYIVLGKQLSSNKSCQGVTGAASNSLTIQYYDGTYPGADGVTIVLSGFYEAA